VVRALATTLNQGEMKHVLEAPLWWRVAGEEPLFPVRLNEIGFVWGSGPPVLEHLPEQGMEANTKRYDGSPG
jgi:hypothetical protein